MNRREISDRKTGCEIMNLFHNLHEAGNTIVLITHDDSVANEAQRKIRILDGRVNAGGGRNDRTIV